MTGRHRFWPRMMLLAGVAAAGVPIAAGARCFDPPADAATTPAQQPDAAGARPSARQGRPDRDLPRQVMDLPPEQRRAKLREFLQGRMERVERTREALASAMKALDNGEALESIVDRFPPDLRAGGGRGGFNADGREPGEGGASMPPSPSGPGAEAMNDFRALGAIETELPVGRGPGQPWKGRDGHAPISAGDREAFDDFLGSAAPGVQRMMRELRAKDSERADRKLREAMPRIGWLIDLRAGDRELYTLRLEDIRAGRDALEAARRIARFDHEHPSQPDAPERAQLAEKATLLLESQYELRGRILARELDRSERALTDRRADLARRPDGRASAVQSTLATLIEHAAEWINHPRDRHPGPHSPDADDHPGSTDADSHGVPAPRGR